MGAVNAVDITEIFMPLQTTILLFKTKTLKPTNFRRDAWSAWYEHLRCFISLVQSQIDIPLATQMDIAVDRWNNYLYNEHLLRPSRWESQQTYYWEQQLLIDILNNNVCTRRLSNPQQWQMPCLWNQSFDRQGKLSLLWTGNSWCAAKCSEIFFVKNWIVVDKWQNDIIVLSLSPRLLFGCVNKRNYIYTKNIVSICIHCHVSSIAGSNMYVFLLVVPDQFVIVWLLSHFFFVTRATWENYSVIITKDEISDFFWYDSVSSKMTSNGSFILSVVLRWSPWYVLRRRYQLLNKLKPSIHLHGILISLRLSRPACLSFDK